MSSRRTALAVAAAAFLVATGVAGANVALTRVSTDPYTNATSQHATEVEPDTFADGAHGRRHVPGRPLLQRRRDATSASRVRGRRRDLGRAGLPAGEDVQLRRRVSPYERVSDASVAYDAAHGVWIVSSIPLLPNTSVPTVFVNRSTDDGLTWARPVRCRRRSRTRSISTRTGRSATTIRRARSTATATRSSTTSARVTSS